MKRKPLALALLPLIGAAPRPDAAPILIAVDARDVAHGIVTVTETLPARPPGALTLRYPRWIPGTHHASGPIARLAGLRFTQNGRPVAWVRDAVDPYSFHLTLPARGPLVAQFAYLSPTDGAQGDVTMTPAMQILSWHTVSLYPAGVPVAALRVQARATFPQGWRSASALGPEDAGDDVAYPETDYATLVDSPVLAARAMRRETLAPGVRLNIAADTPEQLAATPDQIAAHRAMVRQALAVFGARPFRRYDFLFWLSDTMDGQGLEHRASSENGVPAGYFTDWAHMAARRNLLAHEFTHSWNGKFRRPAGLLTPDFATPMRGELLWMYEGQTRFWDYVLQSRSGLVDRQDTLDGLARIAAYYQSAPAFDWRSIADTANDVLMPGDQGRGWADYQGSSDYYEAGKLVWLDIDQLIRARTGNARSLDDFAAIFFAGGSAGAPVSPYGLPDIVAALNRVMPYDWMRYLRSHLYTPARPPLDWIARGGYRLAFVDTPPPYWQSIELRAGASDLRHAIGLSVGADGGVRDVAWEGPAYRAGMAPGATILQVAGQPFTTAALLRAIREAKGGTRPIDLTVRQSGEVRAVSIPWFGGLRYPTLERVGTGPAGLDQMLAPR
ncbi:M61 family metallopeptidase [Sphingomonas hengshuiensis]|uniref:M61 family metallopeptidase n=1 Tax=Sphingomonas hengshuiensis TaxID=1609977 RepID=UPI000699168C|nr:M61 family metallopeptidase [Sphingomonas hengshuiensis]